MTVDELARALWEAYQEGRYFLGPYEEYWEGDREHWEARARQLLRFSEVRHDEDEEADDA